MDKLRQSFDLPSENTVICDVDEVVLHFLGPFREFLLEHGYYLRSVDYSLNNNIMVKKTNELAGNECVKRLISEFYNSNGSNLPAVEDSQKVLEELSKFAQVILLTNIPGQFHELRKRNLKTLGLNYHLIMNSGPKGPVIGEIARKTEGHVFFLDDIPGNLASAEEHYEDIHLIHFVADAKFFSLAPKVESARLKTRNWMDVAKYIGGCIGDS